MTSKTSVVDKGYEERRGKIHKFFLYNISRENMQVIPQMYKKRDFP